MKTCWSGWRTGGVSAKTTDVSHDFGYPLRPGNLQRPSRLANFDTHAHPQGDKDALSLWKRPAERAVRVATLRLHTRCQTCTASSQVRHAFFVTQSVRLGVRSNWAESVLAPPPPFGSPRID
jgi:hypothetical protein